MGQFKELIQLYSYASCGKTQQESRRKEDTEFRVTLLKILPLMFYKS